jgi:predicted  nucleic acid-binding Zn-ribbon protein
VAKAVSAFGQNWNQDRGSQLSSLKAQVAGTTAQIKSLRAQYFKAKDAKTKAKLQAEVDESRRQLAAANEQLAKIENATLRAETQGYLQKIYKVITVINAREWTAQVAGASITAAN